MGKIFQMAGVVLSEGELNPAYVREMGYGSRIVKVALGYFEAKILLSAIELGLFTELGTQQMTGEQIRARLGLHPRATFDFLDSLVSLEFLERAGHGEAALYRNTHETEIYLVRSSPAYIGATLGLMMGPLNFRAWADLTEALKIGGKPPRGRDEFVEESINMLEMATGARPMPPGGVRIPPLVVNYAVGADQILMGAYHALAERFDFSQYKTFCHASGNSGELSIVLARRYPHLRCTSLDFASEMEPIARRKIEAAGLADRVATAIGPYVNLPPADVYCVGAIHHFNLDGKLRVLRAAFEALPKGGAVMTTDSVIDDDRRQNALGLMMSLNMMVEYRDAFDYTPAQFGAWCKEIGFRETQVLPLNGPFSSAIAFK